MRKVTTQEEQRRRAVRRRQFENVAMNALRALRDEERIALVLAVYVRTADELGWSDAVIVRTVNKSLEQRGSALALARQQGSLPPERPEPEEPTTLDERPGALTLARVNTEPSSKCEWCLMSESDPCHSKEARPGTWHAFRARAEG